MQNDRNLFVNIEDVLKVFAKEFKDLTQTDWELVQQFKKKITMSSSFAHKFSRKANELAEV